MISYPVNLYRTRPLRRLPHNPQAGQALVTLIVFMATMLIVTAAAVAVIITSTQGTTRYAQGQESLAAAEAGVDNAVLRLIRDPNYSGETLTVSNGTVVITVTGTTTKTIVAEGNVNNVRRTIQAVGSYTGTVFSVSSWTEIP